MIDYKFIGKRITASTGVADTPHTLRAVYGEKCGIKYAMNDNTRYYKPSWEGTIRLIGDDYAWVMEGAGTATRFGTRYEIDVKWRENLGAWQQLVTLQFVLTDCEIDADNGIITVKPYVKTPYQDVEDGLSREFNLVKLNPVIEQLIWNKRAVLQFTTMSSNVVSNCIGYNTWETNKDNTDGDLVTDYKFAISDIFQIAEIISGNGEGTYYGRTEEWSGTLRDYELPRGVWFPTSIYYYKLRLYETQSSSDSPIIYHIELYQSTSPSSPYTLVASNVGTGNIPSTLTNYNLYNINTSQLYCTLNLRTEIIYARILCDLNVSGTSARPKDDIVPYSSAYRYVMPYSDNIAVITNGRQSDPNEYGQFYGSVSPGYYLPPSSTGYIPILQDDWTNSGISLWISLAAMPSTNAYDKSMTLKHAYPLYSCIKVLLSKIAPNITFDNNTDYSEYLFSATNPVTGTANIELFITPKSNILNGDYKFPAYNASIHLQYILNMLRDVLKCYWYIDSSDRLRIEHVSWFMNGGAYGSSAHVVSNDLTAMRNTRNGKAWSFAKNAYAYSKVEEPHTYTFAWMDEVSEMFKGYQMMMQSPLVDKEKNEEVQVAQFTSDIDYVTISPSDISKDGYMLLGAYNGVNGYYLPYYSYTPAGTSIATSLQNGYLAFAYLEKTAVIKCDIAAGGIEYADGTSGTTTMQSRNMEQKNVIVPLQTPQIEPVQLIRTELGDGEIKEVTINLSSLTANATLRYDTVQQ